MQRLVRFVPVVLLVIVGVGCGQNGDELAEAKSDQIHAELEAERQLVLADQRAQPPATRSSSLSSHGSSLTADIAESVATTVAVDAAEGWFSTFVRARLGDGVALVLFGLVAAVLKFRK